MEEAIELVRKGCLGTCWYGKYHYIEPWVGCQFDCAYCYARFRSQVAHALEARGASFDSPTPLFPPDELLRRLEEAAGSGEIAIAKLSRFTDILTPRFVESGLSHEVLEILAESPVKRIIITTKGLPDGRIRELVIAHREKFSFNIIAKPRADVQLEGAIAPVEERLAAADDLAQRGVPVTIHMDPLVPGLEDGEVRIVEFLATVRRFSLNRIMFSYLLLNDPLIELLRSRFGDGFTERVLSRYDDAPVEVIRGQRETRTIAYRAELKRKSAETISSLLASQGFEYVQCSLKSSAGKAQGSHVRLCDGTFYA